MNASPRPAMGKSLAGMLSMLFAVSVLSVMDALVKWLGADYPIMQIVFFRNALAFVPLLVYLLWTGTRLEALKTRRLGGHLIRSGLGLGAMVTFFYALAHMPLADVIAIGYSAPIFMTVLSIVLLGEKVGPHRWGAVVIGFLGVLVMVRPSGGGGLQSVALVALAAVLLYALAMIQIRVLARTEHPSAIVFYLALFGTLASALSLPWNWVAPDTTGWLLLIGVGLLGGIGQIGLTHAFRLAPVALVAPFDYTAMLWAVAIGWSVWREIPSAATLIGAGVVAACGLYILQRETRLERRAAATASAGAQVSP